VPWGTIDSVRSGVTTDPNDGGERAEMVVVVNSRANLPDDLVGAEWEGPNLRVDTHDWSEPVTDVVDAAQDGLDHSRKVEEIRAMGKPELTWETTVTTPSGPDPSPSPSSETQTKDETT